MAKNAAEAESEVGLKGSRLKKLTVRNFRCIGSKGISIDLDRIVVLVGPNNVGKSTILKAYEMIMDHKSISDEDLCNGKFDADNPPTVELETILGEEKPGQGWIIEDADGTEFIRERWTWSEDKKIKRQGWNPSASDWDEKVPWGAPGVAKARRPKPYRIKAFASPEVQAKEVASLLLNWIKEQPSILNGNEGEDDDSAFGKISKVYREVHTRLVEEAKERVGKAELAIGSMVQSVFADYSVQFEVTPSEPTDKLLDAILANPTLRMGPKDGHKAKIEDQGSGAQRTLLWAALKLLAEERKDTLKPKIKTSKTKVKEIADNDPEERLEEIKRPNVLLIDEPEICLHPSAVREACKTLYDLAESEESNWQVMVTTHSPVFIDFARDHTTVVRVQRDHDGEVNGTTIFRPERAALTEDEQELLKLANIWDPYIAEFFFGGRTVLVEGDTEYSVFKEIVASEPERFTDVHIIRARGKAILVPLIKIMNHFGQAYSALHDADDPTVQTKNGPRTNSMWSENQKIKDAASASTPAIKVRVVASIKDFETALYGIPSKSEKPYVAWSKIQRDRKVKEKAAVLLEALLNHEVALPEGFTEWDNLEGLKQAVENGARIA